MGRVMNILDAIWVWVPQFTKGDLPSWIAVAIALIAVVIATRKPRSYSEINFTSLKFASDGGPITLDVEFTTYSHAATLEASTNLKIDGVENDSCLGSSVCLSPGPERLRTTSSNAHLTYPRSAHT